MNSRDDPLRIQPARCYHAAQRRPAPKVTHEFGSLGIRVIYGRSHIYLNLGICLGSEIQVSDLASFVDVIDVHVYFWCHSLVLIFYHIA